MQNTVNDNRGRPMRDLRISVTDRCNFRCPFCMPAEVYGDRYQFLGKDDLLTFDEITRLARAFVRLGVRKLRVTGGEPLLRPDVEKLVASLAAIDGVEDLALTTNGQLLAQKAQALKDAGATQIASVATVGGIRRELGPGTLVVPDQIIDYTYGRKHTFFEGPEAPVTHIAFTWP